MRQKVVIPSEVISAEGLRVEIARTRVRQLAIAEKVGISEGHLSHLLAGRKALTPELAAQIQAAIAELATPA